ncbi:MAG: hypothetical protein AB4352_03665 [Hormoscilla sp.]
MIFADQARQRKPRSRGIRKNTGSGSWQWNKLWRRSMAVPKGIILTAGLRI